MPTCCSKQGHALEIGAASVRRMRILHWYPSLFEGGGVANAVAGLAGAQACLGIDVAVASATSDASPLYGAVRLHPAVTVIAWRPTWTATTAGLRLRSLTHEATEAFRRYDPHIVHIHGAFNPDNLRVPRILDCPVVLSPHGAFHPEVFTKSRRIGKRVYFGVANRLLYRRVAAYHALCPAEARHVSAIHPSKQVYVVPHGCVSPAQFAGPTVADVRKAIAMLVFVGRLDIYTKGLDILLDAFAAASTTAGGQGMRLKLVGPDWRGGLPVLKRRAAALSMLDRIEFTGAIDGEAVGRELERADIYIQLSRHDAFGLAAAEALVAGKPAILSDAMGIASYDEVASLPQVAIVAPQATQAAAALVERVGRLQELAASGRASRPGLEAFFSWQEVALRHLERYDRLARAAKRAVG